MEGIIVIGHGSRSPEARDIFFKIVDALSKKLGCDAYGCSMELSDPKIPETIKVLYDKGIRDITVVPYFLYTGIHIKEDIPEILNEEKKKYSDINIKMAKPLEYSDLLVEVLAERVRGAKDCI